MKSMIFKGNLKIEGVTKVNVITPQGTSYIYKENSKAEALALNLEMSDDGKTLSLFVEHPNPCRDVIDLIDTLPIHIKDGINNTKVSVSNGIITVEPNQNKDE